MPHVDIATDLATGLATDFAAAFRADLTERLRPLSTPERAVKEKAYLRSELEHLGTRVPAVRREALRLARTRVPRELATTKAAADELWSSAVHELRLAALELLAERADLLTPQQLPYLESLVRQARTWALIDVVAPKAVGTLLARYSAVQDAMRAWAADTDFWVRRAALLAYLKNLPAGRTPFHDFTAVADPLLEDREFFVRKAMGWVLREYGKVAPDEVFGWLWPRRARAARLTVREAAKYLRDEQRSALFSG